MNNLAARFATAAERLAGTAYRLHGRNPEQGLDCVGLVVAALELAGRQAHAPQGYSLRNRTVTAHLHFAARNGFAPCSGSAERGDLLMVRPGPAQHHLLIALGAGRVAHAHAGLRRVVIQPRPHEWPVLAHWRLSSD